MNDDDDDKETPGSGSRWEPADAAGSGSPDAGWTPPEAPPADLPADPAAPTRGSRLRPRVALAGVGAALLVAGGVGGFALGHEAAGTGASETAVAHGTNPGQRDGDGIAGRPSSGGRGTPPRFDGDGTPGAAGADGSTTGNGTT